MAATIGAIKRTRGPNKQPTKAQVAIRLDPDVLNAFRAGGPGWLTMEELVWHPKTGALLTHAPSTYKIPTANDTPAHFNIARDEAPNPAATIHRSKAVGEPPLLLPFSALLAIRDAVSAVGGHRVDPPLRAPATPEAVMEAIDAVRVGHEGPLPPM